MPGRFRTSQDLVNEALARLGVLAAGQPVDPEDFNYVNKQIDSILRKLAALEIVFVPDPQNIPGEWFIDLADIVAGECCTTFGSTDNDYVKLINKGLGGVQGVDVGMGAAAKSLRHMNRGRPSSETLRAIYF